MNAQILKFSFAIALGASAQLAVLPFASAQEAEATVDAPMDSIEWGASHQQVLAHHERILENEFRAARAEVRDPVRIDRLRKEMRDKVRAQAETWETFDGGRTGYETSAIAEELKVGVNLGMLTIRDEGGLRYYVFENDQLVKIIIPVDVASLDWLPFHEWVYELEVDYGETTSVEEVRDEYGIPNTIAASWEGDDTVLRAENRQNIYNTYLRIFSDASWTDQTQTVAEEESTTRSGSGVGGIMDRLQSQGEREANDDVVDDLLGEETEVQIRLRGDAEEGEESVSGASGGSAMDDNEVLEDVEQETRQQRQRQPSRPAEPEEPEEESGGGMTIY